MDTMFSGWLQNKFPEEINAKYQELLNILWNQQILGLKSMEMTAWLKALVANDYQGYNILEGYSPEVNLSLRGSQTDLQVSFHLIRKKPAPALIIED